MVICAAENCNNEGQVFFPKDKSLRHRWEKAVNRKKLKVTNNTKLCYSHFKVTDFQGDSRNSGQRKLIRKLKKGVVPSIFEYLKHDSLEKVTRETEELLQIFNIDLETASQIEVITHDPIIVGATASAGPQGLRPVVEGPSTLSGEGKPKPPENPEEVPSTAEGRTSIHIAIPPTLFQSYVEQFQHQPILFKGNTGVDDYNKFLKIFAGLFPEAGTVTIKADIVPVDQLYITFMVLKRVTSLNEIATVFYIDIGTLNSIFYTWVMLMKHKFGSIEWPSRDDIMSHFTEEEIKFTPRLIIDRIEIQAPAPKKIQKKKVKDKIPIVKVIIGCTPIGRVSFCSSAYKTQGERDILSDLLKKCDEGDIIMDSVEGCIVDDHLMTVYAHKKYIVFTPKDVVDHMRVPGIFNDTFNLKGCRNVADRFEILRDMPLAYFKMASDISFVCCYLHNLILKLGS